MRIWDPATGTTDRVLQGHTNWVASVCPIQVDGRELLASASYDRTVRIWDPATGMPVTRIPVPSAALAIAGVGAAHLVVGTESGMLALRLTSDRLGTGAG